MVGGARLAGRAWGARPRWWWWAFVDRVGSPMGAIGLFDSLRKNSTSPAIMTSLLTSHQQ
jgi:hypothetical protein